MKGRLPVAFPTFSGAYVGTYTSGTQSKGIYFLSFSSHTGQGWVQPVAELVNPSYLLFSPDRRSLYAVSERLEYQGCCGGAAASFAIDWATGALFSTGLFPTFGKDPCHLSTDKEGKRLFVSNYTQGTCSIFPLLEDGRLLPMCQEIIHLRRQSMGEKPGNPLLQEWSHVHCARLFPDESKLLLCDLGVDRLVCYPYRQGTAVLKPCSSLLFPAGAGPRHFVFHPFLPVIYAACELSSRVAAISLDEKGNMKISQLLSTLPPNASGENACAAVKISSDGRFLYVSNRGHNSLACFSLNTEGKLEWMENIDCGGLCPRDIALDSTGNWLLSANQGSSSLSVFSRSQDTGRLQDTGQRVSVPCPVCLCF